LDAKDASEKLEPTKTPENLDVATKDVIQLLGKIGWWIGKWKSPKLYGGDELELKPDGTFVSEGTLNIDDGSIWLNLANGMLNLKRD